MAKEKIAIKERVNTNIQHPSQYQVILHNDDVTTMEFVVELLKQVFYKSPDEAYNLMMRVHVAGQAVVGVYPLEVARSKVERAMRIARRHGFPLQLTYSPE